ncbi:hypothetical protein Syun_020896 [Stephania yunnanensis]|uniref:Uncharacterized protein n=1 Tax=Stephania yunnanensis TaxID=152371 RepID=A0AAP0NQ52_9MAGN
MPSVSASSSRSSSTVISLRHSLCLTHSSSPPHTSSSTSPTPRCAIDSLNPSSSFASAAASSPTTPPGAPTSAKNPRSCSPNPIHAPPTSAASFSPPTSVASSSTPPSTIIVDNMANFFNKRLGIFKGWFDYSNMLGKMKKWKKKRKKIEQSTGEQSHRLATNYLEVVERFGKFSNICGRDRNLWKKREREVSREKQREYDGIYMDESELAFMGTIFVQSNDNSKELRTDLREPEGLTKKHSQDGEVNVKKT